MIKRRKNKYRPVYNRGVQAINYDKTVVDNYLEEEKAGTAGGQAAEGIITAGADIAVPGAGQILTGASALGKGIAGDQTDTTKNVIGDAIDPFSRLNAVASGNFKEAIPVFGSISQSKRIRGEKEALENELKRKASQTEGNAMITSDVTQGQAIARKGRRYAKGTKGVKGDGKTPKAAKPTNDFEKIRRDVETYQPFFTPEYMKENKGLERTGETYTRKDYDQLLAYLDDYEADQSTAGKLGGSLQYLQSIRGAFEKNPNLEEIEVAEVNFDEFKGQDAYDASLFGAASGKRERVPIRFKEMPKEEKGKSYEPAFISPKMVIPQSVPYEGQEKERKEPEEQGTGEYRFKGMKNVQSSKQAKQSSKRNKLQYEKGTSSINSQNDIPVEVEKDEMIFRKTNGAWKLIADFKNGLTHEQGGEDTSVQDGDVIFPGSKRGKIMGLLSTNGTISKEYLPTFESERMKLPADSKDGTAANGLSGNAISAGFQALPAISNLIEGTKPAEETFRRKINPKKIRFVDTSQDQLNAAEESFRMDQENITRGAGGSAGVLLSNVGAASSRRTKNKSAIFADRANRQQQVEATNVQIGNEADRINTNLDIQFDVQDAQNQAARRAFTREGITGISDVGQQYIKNEGLQARDEKLMDLEERKLGLLEGAYSNFTVDEDGNPIYRGRKDMIDKLKSQKAPTVKRKGFEQKTGLEDLNIQGVEEAKNPLSIDNIFSNLTFGSSKIKTS